MLYVFVEKLNPTIVNEISIARKEANPEIRFCFDPDTRKQREVMNIKNADTISGNTGGVNVISWNVDKNSTSYEMGAYFTLAHKPDFNKFVLLDDVINPKGYKTFFLDKANDCNYPDRFYKLPSFATYSDVLSYGIDKELIKSFSLANKSKFQKTNKTEQGQIVYRELKTGNFWYLDNLHKDHYEVFDSNGKHIAEADMDGKMIPKSQIKGRTIQV